MDYGSENKPYTKYRGSRIPGRRKLLTGRDERAAESPPGGPGGGPPFPKKHGLSESGRPRSWRKRFLLALLIFFIALLVLAGFLYWRLDREVRASNARVPSDVGAELSEHSGSGQVNILFLGSDQRPDEPGRADTILLMRFNGEKKTISQLSIPRDTLADIPGYGEEKINSAYAWGGPALMMASVKELTGIPIHHYVEIDFAGFPSIVDSLGGVDIDVPAVIDSQYPEGYDWTQVHFDAGPQHMSGERALVYVRVRYSDDDFQRMGRQQQFMEALQKKFTSRGGTLRMPLIAPEIVGNMITDLSTNEILGLGWVKFRTPAERNRKFLLEGSPQYIDGISYVVVDEGQSQEIIREFLSG